MSKLDSFLRGLASPEEQSNTLLVGSKSVNSGKLFALAQRSNGLFAAPVQLAVPNYVLQALLAESRQAYLALLTQLADTRTPNDMAESLRQQVI